MILGCFRLVACIGLLAITGCAKDEDDGDTNAPDPFNSDDLMEETYSELNAEGLHEEIGNESSFYATQPSSGDQSSDNSIVPDESECSGITQPRLRAFGPNITVSYDIDVLEVCSGSMGDVSSSDRFYLRLNVDLFCEGADFSQYDGTLLDDSMNLPIEEDCRNSAVLGSRTNVLFHLKSVTDDGVFELYSKIDESDGGRLCETSVTNDVNSLGACKMTTYSKFYWGEKANYDAEYNADEDYLGGTSGPKHTLIQLTTQGLTYKDDDRFYSSGRFGVFLNGWNGYMTYSGRNHEPEYVLNKGEEEISGVFQGQDVWGLNLVNGTGPGRSTIPQVLNRSSKLTRHFARKVQFARSNLFH